MEHQPPKAEVGCSNHLGCAKPAESAARFSADGAGSRSGHRQVPRRNSRWSLCLPIQLSKRISAIENETVTAYLPSW